MKCPYEYCVYKGDTRGELDTHIQDILGVKGYCYECQKPFADRRTRDRHVVNCHGQQRYECTKCKKQYASKSHANDHVKKLKCYGAKLRPFKLTDAVPDKIQDDGSDPSKEEKEAPPPKRRKSVKASQTKPTRVNPKIKPSTRVPIFKFGASSFGKVS